jgi:uncharacterized damage-inducible protein DinB
MSEIAITPQQVRVLYDYNAWADRRMLDACSGLADEQFTRDLGCSHRSVRDTLAHIMGAAWIWLERWQGRSPSGLPRSDHYDKLSTLRSRWGEIERDLLQFVAGLSKEELEQDRPYRTTEGKSYSQPLWQMLQHLVNHSTYHRGQVAAMLRQLDVKPVATDLIAFYRELGASS